MAMNGGRYWGVVGCIGVYWGVLGGYLGVLGGIRGIGWYSSKHIFQVITKFLILPLPTVRRI